MDTSPRELWGLVLFVLGLLLQAVAVLGISEDRPRY
jgi:hypothetical protein